MNHPIACSLDAADRQPRLDEWRELLRAAVTDVEWPAVDRVRMHLRSDGVHLEHLVSLARQEVACCPFFSFALEIDGQGLVFSVAVPPDATPVLEAFARLVPAAP